MDTLEEPLEEPDVIFKDDIKPRQVLYEEMRFYRDKANTLALKVAQEIKKSPKARGDLLFALYKQMMKNKEELIKIAAILAPFEHAKLQSVEVKQTTEHRFVIRAPDPATTTESWLTSIGKSDNTPLVIDHAPKALSYDKVVDATNTDDYSMYSNSEDDT